MKNYLLTKKLALKTTVWAGGTTTQLAIFPEDAEYLKFNFDFRISYATVEVPESTFTFMPGVTRHLTILKGTLHIHHIDRYQKQLNQFDTHIFSGEWPTKAKGQVTDFNLMKRGGTVGEAETLVLPDKTKNTITLEEKHSHTGLYLFSGNLTIKVDSEIVTLDAGDFILFKHETAKEIILYSKTVCESILSKVIMK